MSQYKLTYVLHSPSEEHGGMFMAEVPALPGCRAWAETHAEVLEILTDVAAQFIQSYRHHGDELPAAVLASEYHGILRESHAEGILLSV